MGFEEWSAFAARRRREMILLALTCSFAGVGLIIDRPKGSLLEWLAVPLIAVGGSVFAWAVWPRAVAPVDARNSLASRLLQRLTFDGRLVALFPAIGVGIILSDLAYNLILSATPDLLTEDIIVLLGAGYLLCYGFLPTRFARERDFVLMFFIAINAILVVPLLVARLFYQDFERSVDLYSWTALAPPLSWTLSAIGVQNSVHSVAGSTAPGLTFVPQNLGIQVTVVITTSCSGIYSFGIFASAFVAFVLAEFDRPTRKVWSLLGIGFLAAYMANVLRMAVIILIGYYSDSAGTDLQNMLLAHSYAGWAIFLAWVTLFWGILLKVMPLENTEPPRLTKAAPDRKRGAKCAICGNFLTPSVPATLCHCGTYLHRVCLDGSSHCPSCGRAAGREQTAPG